MIQMRWIQLACVVLLVAGLAWAPAAMGASPAEELTKRLPDDVIAFAGTSGGDALKGDFEKTALGRIWNDQGVQTFCKAIKTELMAKAKEKSGDPNVGQKIDMVLSGVRLALSRPLVLGVAQAPVQEGPPVAAFAILEGGDRKADLSALVSKLEAMTGGEQIVDKEVGSFKLRGPKDSDFPVYWGWAGDRFVVALNDAQGAAVKYLSQPRSAPPASLGKVQGTDDALIINADIQKARQLAGSVISEQAGEQEVSTFNAVVKNLGLSDVKACCVRAGFSGPDVVVASLLEMPTPGTGVFAACKPIDPAWFGAVDVRAVTASASNVDLAALYDTIMGTIKAASPDDAYPAIQNGLNGFESATNVQIRDGLLASLAGPMVSYALPAGTMAEAPMGGVVLAAKLKDAALFEKTMTAIGEFISQQAKGMFQVGSETRDGDRVVHVWTIAPVAMMGVIPSWSIANDHVVIGSNTPLCDLGVKQLASVGTGAKSLLDAEGYKKVAVGLPKNLSRLTYIDSAVQLNQVMMQAQQMWPMATMLAMQQGIKLPVVLPSLTQIAKDMSPSIDYCYVSPDGLRSLYRGSGIEAGQMTIAGTAVGLGIAMPALARTRQQARIVASMSNLKQIGVALHMYADDHDDKLPSALDQLGRYLDNAKVLESPRKPKDFEGPSYIYIPDQSTEGNPGNIVAYENPKFDGDKIVALFLDGHVERMTPDRFRSELQATYERLGRKMPETEA